MEKPVLFPNPVEKGDSVKIQGFRLPSVGKVNIQVFSLSFRMVLEETLQAKPREELELPLLDPLGVPLANGLYYVVVTSGGVQWTGKLLVLR